MKCRIGQQDRCKLQGCSWKKVFGYLCNDEKKVNAYRKQRENDEKYTSKKIIKKTPKSEEFKISQSKSNFDIGVCSSNSFKIASSNDFKKIKCSDSYKELKK